MYEWAVIPSIKNSFLDRSCKFSYNSNLCLFSNLKTTNCNDCYPWSVLVEASSKVLASKKILSSFCSIPKPSQSLLFLCEVDVFYACVYIVEMYRLQCLPLILYIIGILFQSVSSVTNYFSKGSANII